MDSYELLEEEKKLVLEDKYSDATKTFRARTGLGLITIKKIFDNVRLELRLDRIEKVLDRIVLEIDGESWRAWYEREIQ